MEYITVSEEETELLGAKLARKLGANAFVALKGGLGAGKTAFARGFARELGDNSASSPTFTIAHEYDTQPKVFHFDVYRLGNALELEDIGYYDYVDRGGIILMEWPENVADILPKDRIEVTIEPISDNKRKINIDAYTDSIENDFDSLG